MVNTTRPNDAVVATGATDQMPVLDVRELQRELSKCRQALDSTRAEIAALHVRLEQSEEMAVHLPAVEKNRDRIATILASHLATPPVQVEPVELKGWRGWLINRLGNGKPMFWLVDPSDSLVEVVENSTLFDAAWYLSTYPDVAEARERPALHYLHHGAKEGRSPGPAFDTNFYLSRYPDVCEADINPLIHYLQTGMAEGRLARHPDAGRIEGIVDRK